MNKHNILYIYDVIPSLSLYIYIYTKINTIHYKTKLMATKRKVSFSPIPEEKKSKMEQEEERREEEEKDKGKEEEGDYEVTLNEIQGPLTSFSEFITQLLDSTTDKMDSSLAKQLYPFNTDQEYNQKAFGTAHYLRSASDCALDMITFTKQNVIEEKSDKECKCYTISMINPQNYIDLHQLLVESHASEANKAVAVAYFQFFLHIARRMNTIIHFRLVWDNVRRILEF